MWRSKKGKEHEDQSGIRRKMCHFLLVEFQAACHIRPGQQILQKVVRCSNVVPHKHTKPVRNVCSGVTEQSSHRTSC